MWFGAIRVDSGAMPIGNLTAFLTYVMQILFSVMMAVIMFVMVPRAAVSAERIQAVLDTEPSVARSRGDPAPAPAAVAARSSSATSSSATRVPRTPVLRAISFTAGPGETTAIVGSTGSGKIDARQPHPALLRRHRRRASSSTAWTSATCARKTSGGASASCRRRRSCSAGRSPSNLRYGDERGHRRRALARARRSPRRGTSSSEMPDGLEAPIDQGGTNVSGGQRQRLAIARALVKRPEIYIFDDSFSALDFKTDSRLRAALRRETRRGDGHHRRPAGRARSCTPTGSSSWTTARSSASAPTPSSCETCETYREIVYSQLTEEEVA